MKQNSIKEMFGKNLFPIIFAALIFGLFVTSAQAATLLLPSGSNVNDVAVDSISGTVYITKNDGTLHSSANGVNFTQMLAPPNEPVPGDTGVCFDRFGNPTGFTEYYLKFKPDRINVTPSGVLWAVMVAEKWRRACSGFEHQIFNYSQNFLFRYDGANWIKRENAPNPSDVGVSPSSFFQFGTVFVSSNTSPYGMFYAGSQSGTGNFSNTGGTGFARVDARNTNTAWGVGYNGTLWRYAGNVIPPGSPWFNSGQTNVKDVAVNKTTGRIYITRTSQAGGTIWYSDDNGLSFQQEPATGFQNLAVTSNGVLYGAGYNGSLWIFQ